MLIQYIRITFDPPASRYGRKLPEVTREAHRVGMLYWHRVFAPRHFQPGAAAKYRYKKRRKKYRDKKKRLAAVGKVKDGGTLDLVHSGLTRQKVLAIPQIKAYPTRARLTMYTPSYVKMRPRKASNPHMAAEITRHAQHEKVEIEHVMAATAERGLKAINDKRTVIVG